MISIRTFVLAVAQLVFWQAALAQSARSYSASVAGFADTDILTGIAIDVIGRSRIF